MKADDLRIYAHGSGYRLLDAVGIPETSDFATLAEAVEEKVRRFIFKGARGLSGSETFNELQERLFTEVRNRFMPKNKDGYTDGWCRDFDSEHVYYTAGGKIFAVSYTDGKDGLTFGLPVEVKAKTVYEKVAFSLGSVAEFAKDTAGMVVKEGKIFEAGDYPDKGVTVSEEELDAMAKDFTAVPNDLEHMDTILDGKLGRLEKVWRKGKELFGRVTVPEWIAEATGEEPIKVSIALNRAKKIVGNALVLNPRVEDACIMRAFSRATTEKKRDEGEPNMKIRDLLKVFGIQAAASLDDDVPEGAGINPAVFAAPSSSEGDPERSKLEQELAQFRAQEKNRRQAAIEEATKAFSRSLIESGAILPAAAEKVEALYSTALLADGKDGAVTFSDGGAIVEGANVQTLREVLSAKSTGPVSLQGSIAFAGAPATGDEAAEKEAEKILASTQFGRSIKTEAK